MQACDFRTVDFGKGILAVMDTVASWLTLALSHVSLMVDKKAAFLVDSVPAVYWRCMLGIAVYFGVGMFVLLVRPLWILRMGEALESSPEIPASLLFRFLAFFGQRILLGPFFRYSNIVLNAWVKAHIKTLRDRKSVV
jgi:hypothetical protein